MHIFQGVNRMNKLRNLILTVLVTATIIFVSNYINYKINGDNYNFLSLAIITIAVFVVAAIICIIILVLHNKLKNKRK